MKKPTRSDWLEIKSIACEIANASTAEMNRECARLCVKMRNHLGSLLKAYPDDARLVATLADYQENAKEELRLLRLAYAKSKRQGDVLNALLTSVDIASVHFEKFLNHSSSKFWLKRATRLLRVKRNRYASNEIRRLSKQMGL